MKIVMEKDRETKNTVRFAEVEAGAGQHEEHPGYNVIGTLYVQKAACVALGNPERIVVNVEAV